MSDSEYDEENLDDFMVKASSVLSQENHPDKETMFESLKHHLATIFSDQSEMENFFKTLNSVIYLSKSKKSSQKIANKQPFKLYPLIFSFNPKSSFFYVDYYLTTLQLTASEDNRQDFPYLSQIFGEVINAFFSDAKENKNLIKKNNVLEENKKSKLYEKLLNFCNNNIKTNKKTEQSFGCLMLTEFLEKCPLAKEEKNLENLFKIISEYLDDRWFECKLDLLNCTISLIFTGEKNFKPYASKCLLKILDYLMDEEWMKRKLAVNIVYTLLFYCKEEVLSMKDNIIDFLNTLQNDPVKEVREGCLQTLNYIKDLDPEPEEDIINFDDDNLNNNKSNNRSYNGTNRGDYTKKNNKSSKSSSSRVGMNKKGGKNNISLKLKKEKEILEKLEKEYNEKRDNFYNKGNKSLSKEYKEDKENNEKNENNEKLNEQFGLTIYNISQQLKKIQEEQNELNNMFEEVKQTIDNNYTSLNERLKVLENKSSLYNGYRNK